MKRNRKPAIFNGTFGMSAFARKKRLKNPRPGTGGDGTMVDSIYYGGPTVSKSQDGVRIVASKKICFDEPRIV